jgi:multidrug resistance efflux pump
MTIQRYLSTQALFCLAALVVGCSDVDAVPVATPVSSEPGTNSLTCVVQRGRVAREIEFTGRISPVEDIPLYFKTAGYVKDVFVKTGDRVKAGDLLAGLEIESGVDSLQDTISAAELNLALAEARLTQAEEDNAYAITQAEMALALAQEELSRTKSLRTTYTTGTATARVATERAQDQVKRAEAEYRTLLQDRAWEPEKVREAYALALRQAQWDLEVARARYDQAIADEGTYWHELRIAEIAVSQAEAELERLRKGTGLVLTIEVQQAQQALARLVDSSRITAPADGEVVSLSLYPGRPAEPFRPVIVIADLSAIEVSASLTDDQLQALAEGQKATIFHGLNPDHTWDGIIRRLPYPYGMGGSDENSTGIDNSTRISLEGDLNELKLGDPVHVVIVLEEKNDVLWLPPTAISTLQGRTLVTVQDGERQRRVYIELGIESKDRVEILEGLRENQVVVTP